MHARLIITVDYQDDPDREFLMQIIQGLNESGKVTRATLERPGLLWMTVEDLANGKTR